MKSSGVLQKKEKKRIGDSTGNGKAVSSLYPGISDFTVQGQKEKLCGFACAVLDVDKISKEAGWEDLKNKGYSYKLVTESGSSAISMGKCG